MLFSFDVRTCGKHAPMYCFRPISSAVVSFRVQYLTVRHICKIYEKNKKVKCIKHFSYIFYHLIITKNTNHKKFQIRQMVKR